MILPQLCDSPNIHSNLWQDVIFQSIFCKIRAHLTISLANYLLVCAWSKLILQNRVSLWAERSDILAFPLNSSRIIVEMHFKGGLSTILACPIQCWSEFNGQFQPKSSEVTHHSVKYDLFFQNLNLCPLGKLENKRRWL